MQSRLRLTRRQILGFRRRVGGLDERMPRRGVAAAGGVGRLAGQHAESRAPLDARTRGRGRPSTWEDPSLAQLWGPRYSAYVVAKRDFALFSLGRLPDSEKGRLRAERTAERLHAHLGGARMTDREAGRALDLGNSIRYAATTGTVAIRWDGARAPIIWTVAAADIDPADACRELARRHLHVFGPTTADGFARWAGISRRSAANAFASLEGSLLPVRSPLGDEALLAEDEPTMRARRRRRRRARAPAAERRRVLPARRGGAGAPRPTGGSAPTALDDARVARRAPRRRRDPRDMETRDPHRTDRRLGTPVAADTRRDRGRGELFAPPRRRPAHRGRLGNVSAAAMQPVSNSSSAMATREAACHCGQLRLEVAGDPLVVSI